METTTATPTLTATNYASFGARLGALVIDWVVIYLLQSFLIVPLLGLVGISLLPDLQNANNLTEEEAIGMLGPIMAAAGAIWLVSIAIFLLYYSFMESSKYQGSIGKMAVGIKVTDMNGAPISFGKALLRTIGKYLSSMIMFIGYLIAAFTEKKQALHDLIASTLVLKK
jgi:uncharacterized RDD family membrane protein YckC